MTRSIILTILTFLFCHQTVFAQDDKTSHIKCQANRANSDVKVKVSEQGFKVHNNLTSLNLNRKGNISFSGDFVIGVTVGNAKTLIDFGGIVWKEAQNDGECFAPEIAVRIIYDPFDVFIGSEFSPHSCVYDMVLEHEMQHVRLYQKNIPSLEATINNLMEKRFKGRPIYVTKGDAHGALGNEIDEIWRPLIRSELAKIQIKQNQIDSEEELDRLSWGCLGEVQNVFGHRFLR